MKDVKTYLLEIIKIVEPEEADELYAMTLYNLIFEDAVYALIQTLPKNKRISVSKKWDENIKNPAALQSLLKHNFSEKQMNEAIEKASRKGVYAYLASKKDSIGKEQKEKLEKLAAEFQPVN